MVGRAAALLTATLLAACGGGGDEGSRPAATATVAPPETASALPEEVAACEDSGPGWRAAEVRAGGEPTPAAVLGDGEVGVVLVNESPNDSCEWISFARELARRGLRPLVYQHGGDRDVAGVRSAAQVLRRAGVRRVTIAGGSLGGRIVVETAARGATGVDAAVSLSAEREVSGLPDILPLARRTRVPSLFAGSREDGLTSFGADTRRLFRAAPGRPRSRLLLVGGEAHGISLLADRRMRTAVVRFLRSGG